MVQIIQPSPAQMQAGQLGQAIGLGIGKNFVPPEQMVQRKLIQQSLGEARKKAMQPGQTPIGSLYDLIESTAGIPGAEKYIGQIAPLLMAQINAQESSKVTGAGQPGAENINQPGVSEQGPTQKNTLNPEKWLNNFQNSTGLDLPQPQQELTTDPTLEPAKFGYGPMPNVYTPEQIFEVRSQDLKRGLTESPRANAMEQYNQLSRTQYNDYLNAAKNQSGISEATRASQEKFRTVLQSQLGISPDSKEDIGLAERIAQRPEYRNIGNDVIRAEKIKPEYQRVKQALSNFETTASRPNRLLAPEEWKDRMNSLSHLAEKLKDYGLRDLLTKALAKGGWTESEQSMILNPLSKSIMNSVNDLPKFQEPSLTYGKYPSKVEKVNNSASKKWINFLKNNVVPGKFDPKSNDVISPGTSLILLRNQALKKNMNWADFKDQVIGLVEKGDIKLDPIQEVELSKISRPPNETLSVGEFLLGVPGK